MKKIIIALTINLLLASVAFAKKVTKEEAEKAYSTLGLAFNSTLVEARKKRGQLISGIHPDQLGSEVQLERAKEINSSVNTIKEWLIQQEPSSVTLNKNDPSHYEQNFARNYYTTNSLNNINLNDYLKLLFHSQFFTNNSLAENLNSMFDLVYRLYSLGYTRDVLASLRQMFFNPFADPRSFKYEAAFPGLVDKFGDGGRYLENSFQLLEAPSSQGFGNYSHILIYFDAETTRLLGLPRFRTFLINPNSDSADEVLSLYRNHNNDLPRFQIFQSYQFDDLYMVDDSGNRTLAAPASNQLITIDFSIIDAGNPSPSYLVDIDFENGSQSLVGAHQLNPKDLGSYLTTPGVRIFRTGGDLHSSFKGFESMYTAVKPDQVREVLRQHKILEKISNANGKNFVWPHLIGTAAFIDLDRTEFNSGGKESSCDSALLEEQRKKLQ